MPKEIVSLTRKQISEFAKDQQTVRAIESLFTVSQDMIGNKGDITVEVNGWFINNNVVENENLATVNQGTIKGRSSAGVGNVEDLTPTQVSNILPVFTTTDKGQVPASGANVNNFLRGDGTWSIVTGTITDGDKGDIDVTGAGSIWTIDNNAVNNPKMAQMADGTIKGNISGTLANPSDLTFTEVTQNLDVFSVTENGVVPAPLTATGRFLQDGGTWVDVTGTIPDGNKGDITVSSSGSVFSINNNVVTNLKLSQMPSNTIKGNNTGATANSIDLTSEDVATMLPTFSVGQKGVVPDPVTVSGRILSDNGAFVPPELVVPLFTNSTPGIVNPPITTTGKVLRDGNTWALVDNANMATMPSNTIKGNNTGAAAQPINLSASDVVAILPNFTAASKGVVPAPVTSTNRVLVDNATWQTVSTVLDTLGASPNGSILYKGASSWSVLTPGAVGTFLSVGASSVPQWSIIGEWQTIARTTIQSTTSSAFIIDPIMFFNISAGKYIFESTLFFQVRSNPSGVKVTCGFFAASNPAFDVTSGESYGSGITANQSSLGPGNAAVVHTATQIGFVTVVYKGSVSVSASGAISMRWAQNVTNANALDILPGSFFKILRIL